MSSAGHAKSDDGKRPSTNNKNGDWTCPEPDCKNLNFARRNQCNRCGKERPGSASSKHGSTASDSDGGGSGGKKKVGTEIGKAAAEKSRGLFSAEDWQCNKCANVNWARRHTCNICSAPRFCDVEERTGYGGGYNDRGVVEYKDRVESDDEYDEFGRRKKSKGKSKEQIGGRLASRRRRTDSTDEDEESERSKRKEPRRRRSESKEEDEDEDDDEDEEDNGDLSKYDLWGSDAEEAGKKPATKSSGDNNKSTSRQHRSRSHSRSRSTSRDRNRRPTSDVRRSSKSISSSSSHGRSDTKRSSSTRRPARHRSRSSSSRSRSRSRSPRSYRRSKDKRR
ncbi:zinc finger Ran-binding domain-containing protein 2 [Anopheles bellator]|uniref:zinc finger Ran-binding domain-containing protein 2 n=1 Tax=Anopheles bellator TaxID=139047 RepID=UPI0026493B41|nr:zinc finger Ran-binding domain-containing protein 2 [Anopheles bellator]